MCPLAGPEGLVRCAGRFESGVLDRPIRCEKIAYAATIPGRSELRNAAVIFSLPVASARPLPFFVRVAAAIVVISAPLVVVMEVVMFEVMHEDAKFSRFSLAGRRDECESTSDRGQSIFRRSGHRFAAENATKQEAKAFSDEVCTGSSKKMRPNKKLKRRAVYRDHSERGALVPDLLQQCKEWNALRACWWRIERCKNVSW